MRSAFVILSAVAAGCQSPAPPPAARALEAMVDVADPDAAVQLVNGFHAIEWGNGRWTKQSFAVSLKPPRTARERGATLRVKLDLPQPLIEQEKKLTMTCTVGGKGLQEESWEASGPHVFSREVPPFEADPAPVICKLDKKFVVSGDARELGVVLHAIGLEPN